jgi:hypothetical protein
VKLQALLARMMSRSGLPDAACSPVVIGVGGPAPYRSRARGPPSASDGTTLRPSDPELRGRGRSRAEAYLYRGVVRPQRGVAVADARQPKNANE